MLDALGMIWSVSDARFEAGLDWARVWAKGHGGSLAAPARASVGGYAIGTWLSELRAAAQVPAGEQGALAPERRRALEEVDPWWCPVWPVAWQRASATARLWWLEADGQVDWPRLPADTVYKGEQLGRWVQAQRGGWPDLEEDQRDLLTAIGIEEDQELVAAKAAAEARPTWIPGRCGSLDTRTSARLSAASSERRVQAPKDKAASSRSQAPAAVAGSHRAATSSLRVSPGVASGS